MEDKEFSLLTILGCILLISVLINIGILFKIITVDCNCDNITETYNNKEN